MKKKLRIFAMPLLILSLLSTPLKADIKITNSEWAQIKEDLATCKTCSNELDRTLLELTECRDEVVSHQYKEWWQSEYAILGIALSSFFLGVTVTSLSK